MELVVILLPILYQQLVLNPSEFGPRMEEGLPAPERGRWGVRGGLRN